MLREALSGGHVRVRANRFPTRRGKGFGRARERKPVLGAGDACVDVSFSAQVCRSYNESYKGTLSKGPVRKRWRNVSVYVYVCACIQRDSFCFCFVLFCFFAWGEACAHFCNNGQPCHSRSLPGIMFTPPCGGESVCLTLHYNTLLPARYISSVC